MSKQPIPPDTGDIVMGLTHETAGHWNIMEITKNNDGTLTIKFIDHHDDEPFWWTGTMDEYHQSFIYELDYNGRTE